MSTKNITSAQYNAIKTQAFRVVGDIREAELGLNKLARLMDEAGMNNVGRDDKESDLQWLGRVATNATELEHDLKRTEAITEVSMRVEGKTTRPLQPTTRIGRMFNSLANLAG